MSPRQGTSRLRRLVVAVAVCALVGAWAPAASADESAMPTTQARAYNADWVPYLDPPEKPAAVCLVDSGVNITPDTPADSPDGPIVKRLALDGGPGTAAGSSWEAMHGTRMAMVAGAPINDWGAVGFWPGVRIVSIRAMPMGATSLPFDTYSRALELCSKNAAQNSIAAVNLSLACQCAPQAPELARLSDQITRAHANNESVVASVGNNADAVGSPASAAGVLGVAAGTHTHTLCTFSNRGTGVDLVAPGCDVDLADPSSGEPWTAYQSGTSGASMTVSVALALLRSYRPDLDWRGGEALVASSAGPGGAIDVEKAFRDAGLGRLVDAAASRAAGEHSERTTGGTPAPDQSAAIPVDPTLPAMPGPPVGRGELGAGTLAGPKIERIIKQRRRMTVVVRRLPARARLVVKLQRRAHEFRYATVASATNASRRVTVGVPRGWRSGRLLVRYELGALRPQTSAATYRLVTR